MARTPAFWDTGIQCIKSDTSYKRSVFECFNAMNEAWSSESGSLVVAVGRDWMRRSDAVPAD